MESVFFRKNNILKIIRTSYCSSIEGGEGRKGEGRKERKERYSLPDSFAVPAPFVRILLADRVGQGAVEGARPDHAGQEIAELHVQLGRQGPAGRRSGSCVHLDPARRRGRRGRRFPRSTGCVRDAPLARRRWFQLRAAAHLPHLKRDRRQRLFIHLSTNRRVSNEFRICCRVSFCPLRYLRRVKQKKKKTVNIERETVTIYHIPARLFEETFSFRNISYLISAVVFNR